MRDVLAKPSTTGLAYRREQLERDRLRLLEQLEREAMETKTHEIAKREPVQRKPRR